MDRVRNEFLALTSAGLLAACATGPAQDATSPPTPAPTLTKTEARQMGEDAAERVALAQLGDYLKPDPFLRTPRPRRALSDMWFHAEPQATQVANLCRSDTVILEFDPVEPDRGANTRVRVSGVRSSTSYRFLAPPTSLEPAWIETDAATKALQAQCAGLADRSGFFLADSAEDAARGYWLVQRALKAASQQDRSIEVTCEGNARAGCKRLLDRAATQDVFEVRHCAPGNCWHAIVGDVDLELHVEPPSDRLLRVVASELVVIADAKID